MKVTPGGSLLNSIAYSTLLRRPGPYAGTASFSFLAASITFWAMCVGTSS